MSNNGFGNEWFQTDDGQNVYSDVNNMPGPSNQEFLLPPSQPPVSMTSQPQPNSPFDWNSMAQTQPTPIEHQNHGFPSQPETNTSWNTYAYQRNNNRHQNLMTSRYQNPHFVHPDHFAKSGIPSSSTTSDFTHETGPEEQPDEEYQNLMTSQKENVEFVNQTVNDYPVHPPNFTNPNVPTSSMTSYSTLGESVSDPALETAPKDNNWPMNKENQMVYDVIDRPGPEYLENEREMTSQYQQPNDELQGDPNPSKSEKPNNPNNPLDAEIPETVTIDTVEFREKVSRELETLGITPGLFSRMVLGKYSDCASYMLRKDKNWDNMHVRGHDNFRRIYNWMEMSREKKMAYFPKCFKKPLVKSSEPFEVFNDPLDAKISDDIIIDTVETYKRVANEIETYKIPKGLFVEKILKITSGHFNKLIKRIEPWDEMSKKVQDNFRRMYNWVEMPLDTRLAFFGPDFEFSPKILTDAQKEHLEAAFQKNQRPPKQEKTQMAEHLQLTFARVDRFFKHRRAKLKKLTKNENVNSE